MENTINDEQTLGPKKFHYFLCKLSRETFDALEDYRLDIQRREGRWVSKRAVLEKAIKQLAVKK